MKDYVIEDGTRFIHGPGEARNRITKLQFPR